MQKQVKTLLQVESIDGKTRAIDKQVTELKHDTRSYLDSTMKPREVAKAPEDPKEKPIEPDT